MTKRQKTIIFAILIFMLFIAGFDSIVDFFAGMADGASDALNDS
ncbi:hypothetical protein PN836_000420 [Ningiella sp. W23]